MLEEKEESKRQRTLARELEWIRMSPRARQAKGKARLNSYEELLADDTMARCGQRGDLHSAGSRASATSSSKRAAYARRYGDLMLIDDLDFTLPKAGIVGVIGPNGAGKTTLFRMLTGGRSPTPARSRSARRCRSVTSTSRASR